ncbi:hypothetical protein quinque_000075 [Culex quinquefasciatus]
MSARKVTLFLLITVVIAANFASAKPVDDVGRPDLTSSEDGLQQSNIIDGPVVCPEGQKPDHNGKCREVWNQSMTLDNLIGPHPKMENSDIIIFQQCLGLTVANSQKANANLDMEGGTFAK